MVARALLAGGAGARLVGPLMVAAAEHPLRERMAGLLMTALHRCGRDAEAAQVFRLLRKRLVEDNGMEPSAALSALHRKMLADEPAPPWLSNDASSRLVPTQLPADPPGFAGRAAELAWLDKVAPDPDAGDGAATVVAVLTGTAGVGKTATAVRWARRVSERRDQTHQRRMTGLPQSRLAR